MTADPAPPLPPRRPASLLKRILALPLVGLATVVVLFDDLFRSALKPALAWLASLEPIRRIEAAVARLPPYPTLALFLIPMAVIWPIKLYALYLIGLGHVAYGTLAFVAAKVVGIGLAERLFAISRDKLLSIGWFARGYFFVIAIHDRVHLYLKGTRWWPRLVAALGRVREGWRALKARTGALVRRLAPRGLLRRLSAAVRRLAGASPPSAP
ncbi:MAG TPA: hypothetical protein VF601_11610 [Beijerinckiaceae bacterium]